MLFVANNLQPPILLFPLSSLRFMLNTVRLVSLKNYCELSIFLGTWWIGKENKKRLKTQSILKYKGSQKSCNLISTMLAPMVVPLQAFYEIAWVYIWESVEVLCFMSTKKERYWVWFCQKERFYPCTIASVFCFSFRILSGLIKRTKGERERGRVFGLRKESIYI